MIGLAAHPGLPLPEPDTEALIPALAGRGVDAVLVDWNDPAVDWSAFDAVLAWKAWDYVDRADDFLAWADRVAAVTRLWNPAGVLRWNAHKGYLPTLGVPIVETVLVERGATVDLAAHGWDEAILKPAVSASAAGLRRVTAADGVVVADTDLLLQPFMHAIADGELSLMYFGGELSHAVLKRPSHGEIRVQEEFGGTVETVPDPPADAIDLAERALAAAGDDLLYARVDMVRDGDGEMRLMELELIEPFLFLDETSAARLADAIAARL